LSPHAKYACRAPLPAFVVPWNSRVFVNVLDTKIFGIAIKVEFQMYYQI
jgi:hypothetical protein